MLKHIEKIRREMRQMRRLIEAHNRGRAGEQYDADRDGALLYVNLAAEAVDAELHEMLKENRK